MKKYLLSLVLGLMVWQGGIGQCTPPTNSYSSQGIEIGNFDGVPIYGNRISGNDYYISNVQYNMNGFITGMKWQCVEYVVRYYYLKYGLDIKRDATHTGDGRTFYDDVVGNTPYRRGGIIAFPNGGNTPPQVGDILGFRDNRSNDSAGHVAIISEVGDNYIKLAQQNAGTVCPVGFSLDYDMANNWIDGKNLRSIYVVQGWLRPPYKLINSGIEIYAGEKNNPEKNVTISVSSEGVPSNFTPTDFQINGFSKPEIVARNENKSGGKATFVIDFPTVNVNCPYNFSFKIGNQTYYGANQIYYINENEYPSGDVDYNKWYAYYMKKGVINGLFKGTYDGTTYKFLPESNLTRGAFAKMVVSAAIRLNMLSLNTNIAGCNFTDIAGSEYQPYILTLFNAGYIDKTNTTFRPNANITLGEMSKILCNTLNLTKSDANINQAKVIGKRVVISSDPKAPDLKQYLEILTEIVAANDMNSSVESLITNLFNIPVAVYSNDATISIDGNSYVTRAQIAKALWNAYHYAARERGSVLRSAAMTTDLSNVTIIGNKFDSNSNGSASSAQIPATFGNITLRPGGTKIIDLSDLPNNFFCYWSINGGTLEDLAPNNAHKKVKFTAPDNITSTETYDLYVYIGNAMGYCAEGFAKITVEVNNTITHLDAPTGLYVGKTGQNFFYVYWDNADWDSVTQYVIQSATNSSFTQNLQEDIKTGGEASRAIVRDPGTYYIRIKAVNTSRGLESAWSQTISYTFDPYLLPDIADSYLKANVSGNSVTLNWSSTGGRNPKYNLYFADWNPFGQTPVLENTTATTYTINNLNYNTTYYWGVKVFDSQGSEDQTNALSFTTVASTVAPIGNITIDYGAVTTNSPLVNLQISAQATSGTIERMQLSNDGTNWTEWIYYTTNRTWSLNEYGGTNTPGVKTVYARFKDNSGNISTVCTGNITLTNTAPGYFYVRDLKTPSLREAIDYAQAGDNIYATAGYFDLTKEVKTESAGIGLTGAILKQGVNLIGEGAGKTTLYWEYITSPSGTTIYSYNGLALGGDNIVEGLTIVTPNIAASATTAESNGRTIMIRGGVSNCTIQNCEIKNSTQALYVLQYNSDVPTNITLQNCLIHDNQNRAIQISEANNLKIYNNTVFNNSISSVYISNVNNAIVKNNIVVNNLPQAISVETGVTFTNNNVWNNKQNDGISRPNDNYDDQSFCLPNQTGINGNISVDPRLDSNHRLLTGSPCIDTGTNVGLSYAGSAPDMGAYETNLPTGSLNIQSNTTANFVVSKPDGSSITITSGQSVSNLEQGYYGIYPQEIYGFYTPQPKIQKITQGANSVQMDYIADTQGPEAKIYLNAGDFFTHSRYISIYNDVVDEVNGLGEGALMQFSNDGITWSPQEPLSNKKLLWNLASYGGNLNPEIKTVHARFCDSKGFWSADITNSIQYIPDGRIRVVTEDNYHSDTIKNAKDGDIILFEEGKYVYRNDIYAKIKLQGVNKNAIIENPWIRFYNNVKMDNLQIYFNTGIIYVIDYDCAFSNLLLTEGTYIEMRNSNMLLTNSVINKLTKSSNALQIVNPDVMLNFYNNLMVGWENTELPNNNSFGLYLTANANAGNNSKIKNNIFLNFSSEQYTSALYIRKLEQYKGEIEIANNNFYNNRKDIDYAQVIVENKSPFNISPAFESNDSYKLVANSPLKHLGSDDIIHHNHDGSKNTLGIEGGLFYNTVPTANATMTSKDLQVTLDASGSFDEQTPAEYLQYRWDYNNDGVFDTDFLLTPVHTVSVELLGDTIVGWVFDEHFSMNYVKIAKSDMKILPSDTKLSVSVTGNTFCAGSRVNITPNITGMFDGDNMFTVELSDASGNFTNSVVLDYIFGNSIEASQLSVTLPGDLSQGAYKIRLSSTEPPVQGQASNAFTVSAADSPEITITASALDICEGTSVTFGATAQNAGSARQYQWYVNDQPTGANSPVFSTSTLKDGDVVKVELSCTEGCYFPSTVVSNEIAIQVKSKQTPSVEIYTNYLDDIPQLGEPVTLFAFAENTGDNATFEWYVNDVLTGGNEPFLTLNYTSNTIVKVKVLCSSECLNSNIAEATYTFGNLTGIESVKVKDLTVYPNPTKDIIKIESKEIVESIELLDLSGKTVLQKQFNQLNPEFTIENYQAGYYLLQIIIKEGGTEVRKIIKI